MAEQVEGKIFWIGTGSSQLPGEGRCAPESSVKCSAPEVTSRVRYLQDPTAISRALLGSGTNSTSSVWVTSSPGATQALIDTICDLNSPNRAREDYASYQHAYRRIAPVKIRGTMLLAEPASLESVPTLRGFCDRVIGDVSEYRLLESSHLWEVITSASRADLLAGCAIDRGSRVITLVRGNASLLVVPFAFFDNVTSETEPDFNDVEVIDYGQTLRLGAYEASTDSILYELDRDYRRRANAARRECNSAFGACLRRLRKQRRLRREDFEPEVSAKTIARIEQGMEHTPRGRTLSLIAEKLGVAPEDILTY
jgi:hypothetical protein